jgi:hypothetical protein
MGEPQERNWGMQEIVHYFLRVPVEKYLVRRNINESLKKIDPVVARYNSICDMGKHGGRGNTWICGNCDYYPVDTYPKNPAGRKIMLLDACKSLSTRDGYEKFLKPEQRKLLDALFG